MKNPVLIIVIKELTVIDLSTSGMPVQKTSQFRSYHRHLSEVAQNVPPGTSKLKERIHLHSLTARQHTANWRLLEHYHLLARHSCFAEHTSGQTAT